MAIKKLQSCCCFDLKTGVLVICILGILSNIGGIIEAPVAYSQACKGWRTIDNDLNCASASSFLGVTISGSIVGLILTSLTLYGSQKEKYQLMVPILILQAIGLGIFFIGACIDSIMNNIQVHKMVVIVLLIIISVTHAMFNNVPKVNIENEYPDLDTCIENGELCDFANHDTCCNETSVCRSVRADNFETVSVCKTPATIEEFCQHDTDCLRLDYAYCSKEFQRCECLLNYGKVKNIPRCVSLLGGHCYDERDCFVDNSICIDHKCQCDAQFIMKSNRECWPSSIGKSCKRDLDCSDVLHVGCSVSKKCVCKDNHILVDNSMCVPLLDEFCWTDELCAPINSVCFNNKCKCKPNYIAVANTHCFEYYIGRSCESNQDCKNILHSVCSEHGVCICDDNYAVVNRDKCVPLIDGACSSNKECRIENSVCVDNKCQCITNYSSLNNNKSLIGDYCRYDTDCLTLDYATCNTDYQECDYIPSYGALTNKSKCVPLVGGYCDEYRHCMVDNSICIDNKCECRDPFITKSNTECLLTSIGKPCKRDIDAPNNSVCLNNKCKCKPDYTAMTNTDCFKRTLCIIVPHVYTYQYSLINDKDNNRKNSCIHYGEQCHFGDRISCCNKSNICRNVNWKPGQSLSVCLTPALIEDYCRYDIDCMRLDYAICSVDFQKCKCLPNYGVLKNNQRCVALIGGYCDHYKQCMVENSICINNKCQCKESYVMRTNRECALTSMGESCKRDIDCSDILHVGCSVEKKCVCKDNHIQVNNSRCVPLLGEFCWTNERCATDNSCVYTDDNPCCNKSTICRNIKRGYEENVSVCLSPALYRDYCQYDTDCLRLDFAKCNTKYNECECLPNYWASANHRRCVPLIGGYCVHKQDCLVDNSICIGNKCQCKESFVMKSNKLCALTSIGKSCKKDIDCSDILHIGCSVSKKCVCKNNHILVDNSMCVPLLDEFCWTDELCAPNNSICFNNKCKCKPNYIAVANTHCYELVMAIVTTESVSIAPFVMETVVMTTVTMGMISHVSG
ncbi:prion-like-(Q/N-rich) domain-bearing protein 25 [Microplitis demolitor]|uniref:prion-like-(Q/N-rich) domain-bearing protein 25 n=1 Tax=Microplitis demolitor TaxID=69319 RepID=UPI00235B69D5|nr:prion-like-(Q/N-rich) domain-bearing protein 25 [Microplitis demolitor]